MRSSEILGKKEGLRIELKAREILDQPAAVGREAVGMLNAEGGVIWIGVQEAQARAVSLQPIEEAETEASRLLNHLVDTIEPSPRRSEVEVSACDVEGLGHLIRVATQPEKSRKPYAQLKSGGRHFYVRIGDRNRIMTREELMKAWTGTSGEEDDTVLHDMLREREQAQKGGRNVLSLDIRPSPKIELDTQDAALASLLQDPSETGNRPTGWVFANPYRPFERSQGRISLGVLEGIQTVVYRTGKIAFSAPLQSLHWKGQEKEIWPYALLEFPTSVFRLAAKIYGRIEPQPSSLVIADLALFGLAGWTLRPYSPSVYGYQIHSMEHPEWPFKDGRDFMLGSPGRFRWEEVCEEPDWCAYRLISQIYEAYGYGRELIPQEFDPKSRKLLING